MIRWTLEKHLGGLVRSWLGIVDGEVRFKISRSYRTPRRKTSVGWGIGNTPEYTLTHGRQYVGTFEKLKMAKEAAAKRA